MQLSTEDQRRRALAFRDLHTAPGAFVIANAWDAGTARLLSGLGFAALATTSAGLAFALGRADGANLVDRDEALANARAIVAATELPVAADLENGFGRSPQEVAETIRLAAATGLVGGSIEDATGRSSEPIFPFEAAVERVRAAVAAARELDFPFTVTARAENFLHGRPDLDDTVRRLRAFEAAGADVLFAPGLPDAEAVRTVCSAVSKPVSVIAAGPIAELTVDQLAELGARRISVGSAFARLALAAAQRSAAEILRTGGFGSFAGAVPMAEINAVMEQPA
ncbi:isocitrate lyase/phosphoenolpyruvate mutase family protein [Kitasatospora sp. NBC_01287]|uniref:isocitrate lyase/PEP mutase family protein n=1 Tax=Kitasatospora sp. NBC_01287 TaxID=2903573 RepID=UPI002252F017|nr:isocitrate lyase/phosphoenolpyruvate mutase family protein [Kitasatospora sp. NBC_01287]MCX4744852.1 isocitrate lyase/phosphoenolpyruvate mutase family protein [Kitasatospora sp. NBC_01287]